MTKDTIIEIEKGVIYALIGLVFWKLSELLPEWMMGMMIVGAIALGFCIYKVM